MLSKPLVSAALKPLILSMLAEGPMYGFQITYRAKMLADGQVQWSNSKLYPLLHKLEQKGLVEAFWKPSKEGPDRKYYRITPGGREALATAKSEWLKVNAMFARLWAPDVSPA
ncbi:MAG: PadR family transcriptional regulator PadR [Thalassolituus oleivorans]|jgi:PadR family transcriptional regulator PadR